MKKSSNGKKAAIILIIIAVIVTGGLIGGRYFTKRMNQSLVKDMVRFTAKRGDLSFTAVGSGKIASSSVNTIVPKGALTELKVKVGDYVKKNDILATYTDFTGEESSLVTEYEGVITSVPSGGNDLTSIKSASSYFEVSGTGSLQIDVQVTEKDVYRIKKGQKATIYIDALNKTVDGSVSRISQAGKTAGDFTVYDVTVSFKKDDSNIFLGMTGSARILTQTRKNVLLVPVDAIIEKDNRNYLLESKWLSNLNSPMSDYYLEVETGLSDTENVEIIKGDVEDKEFVIVPDSKINAFPGARLGR